MWSMGTARVDWRQYGLDVSYGPCSLEHDPALVWAVLLLMCCIKDGDASCQERAFVGYGCWYRCLNSSLITPLGIADLPSCCPASTTLPRGAEQQGMRGRFRALSTPGTQPCLQPALEQTVGQPQDGFCSPPKSSGSTALACAPFLLCCCGLQWPRDARIASDSGMSNGMQWHYVSRAPWALVSSPLHCSFCLPVIQKVYQLWMWCRILALFLPLPSSEILCAHTS